MPTLSELLEYVANPKYGKRPSGEYKGKGWLGEIRMPDGISVMTEQTADSDGMYYPTIYKGMHPADLNYMRETGHPARSTGDTAYAMAIKRREQGLSPYITISDLLGLND